MRILFTFFFMAFLGIAVSSYAGPSGGGSVHSLTNEDVSVAVYPNPAHGNLYIACDGASDAMVVTIYDALGNMVSGYNVESVNSNVLQIELTTFQPGVYFVTVALGDHVTTERVVIS